MENSLLPQSTCKTRWGWLTYRTDYWYDHRWRSKDIGCRTTAQLESTRLSTRQLELGKYQAHILESQDSHWWWVRGATGKELVRNIAKQVNSASRCMWMKRGEHWPNHTGREWGDEQLQPEAWSAWVSWTWQCWDVVSALSRQHSLGQLNVSCFVAPSGFVITESLH